MWMKELDMRLAFSIVLLRITAYMLSALYCWVISFQITGSLNSLARESRSEYSRESQTTCMSFLYIFTFRRATTNPIFVVSRAGTVSARARESAAWSPGRES